jgi:hypothetical protein
MTRVRNAVHSLTDRIRPGDILTLEEEVTMADGKGDERVLGHIRELVDEERALHEDRGRDAGAQQRLESIRVELDQCWDLLRQRRALREFGEDPNRAKVRPPNIVENYEQ